MQEVKIYNSLKNKIEVFKPIEEGKVSIYVCGPTVYGNLHIGNARPIAVFDIFVKALRKMGYEVTYMSNVTDIDDKIIRKAIEEGISEKEVAEKYFNAYLDVRKGLNTVNPDYMPKVTDNIQGIVDFIARLIEKGYAYESDGDVFFRVSKAKEYGCLSHFNVEDLKVGARIEENSSKESPMDFALWKKTDQGIKWDTAWSSGRPGWHTECVVMINSLYPNGLIDIHGGGFDLKFPHHENEIAQSYAIHNHGLANYWMHNGMVNIDNVKMSKSLGNTKGAQEMIDKYGGNTVRWVFASTHYRAPVNFTEEVFDAAKLQLNKVLTPIKQAQIQLALAGVTLDKEDEVSINKFLECMADDLNTANGQMVIYDVVKEINTLIRQKGQLELLAQKVKSLMAMLDIFGIKYQVLELSDEDKELFAKWNEYKSQKDFANADIIRNELMNKGLL